MTPFAAIILAPFLFENDYLVTPRLLNDTSAYRCVGHNRCPDCRARATTDSQNLGQDNLGAHIAGDSFDHNLVARSDAVLFAAGLYDCKHD